MIHPISNTVHTHTSNKQSTTNRTVYVSCTMYDVLTESLRDEARASLFLLGSALEPTYGLPLMLKVSSCIFQ